VCGLAAIFMMSNQVCIAAVNFFPYRSALFTLLKLVISVKGFLNYNIGFYVTQLLGAHVCLHNPRTSSFLRTK
jgi:hypothetical protein